MKKALALLIAVVASVMVTEGQPTFQRYCSASGSQLNIHELASGNLFFGNSFEVGTSILDQEGNYVHTHTYEVDTLFGFLSIEKVSNNEFVFASSYKKCGALINARSPMYGSMDSMGVILSSYYYDMNGPNCIFSGRDIEYFGESGSMLFNSNDMSNYLLKIDPLGTYQWSRIFNALGKIQFVKELPNGDLIVGLSLEMGGASVARLDENGNFIWLKSYFRPNGVVRDCIVESDNSFTVVGYTNENAGPDNSLFLMRLNGAGEVQWCKGYHYFDEGITFRAKMVRSQDGNYVTLSGPPGALLMKLDQNGDTLWTRQHGIPNMTYYIADLLAHSDGGFLYSGHHDSDFGLGQFGGAFLFKADSLGHLPCPEHERIANVQVSDLFPTDSSFTMSFTEGATRYPAYITDATTVPIQLIDGCTVTQIASNAQKTSHPRIRPNPTTGQFTLSFDDPLIADTFYSVYDSMGKLLYQRPLPSGATTAEVDLARYGKGMYLLKITDPEGVRTERIVVE